MLNPFKSEKRYPNLQKMDKNALKQHLNTSYVNLTEMDVIYSKTFGNSYQQKWSLVHETVWDFLSQLCGSRRSCKRSCEMQHTGQ